MAILTETGRYQHSTKGCLGSKMTRDEAMQIYQRLDEIHESLEDSDDRTALLQLLDLKHDMYEIGMTEAK